MNVKVPTKMDKDIVAILKESSGSLGFKNSAAAIRADAMPPKPLKIATI